MTEAASMNWSREFDEPIALPDGGELRTLLDTGRYVNALPCSMHEREEWQAVMEVLLSAEGREPVIAQFETRHAIGTRARLAMALGIYTGQARQDVVRMGEQHITDEVLAWVRLKTEDKTGFELAIPVHPELRQIINATPSGHLTFLATEFGAPFTPAGFGNWFRDRCNEAGLPQCSFHGLRKAASSRLADAGCNAIEIAAITGHASLREVERYIETRDRRLAARRAMDKLLRPKPEQEVANPVIRFADQAKKA